MPYNNPSPEPIHLQPRLAQPQWSWRAVFQLMKAAVQSWSDDRAASMGASLAYYTLFSIAPLVLIVIATAGLLFGEDAARGAIFSQLSGLMGADGAYAIQSLIASVEKHQQSGWGAVLGVVLLVVGATTVVAELHAAMDVIWKAPKTTKAPGWLQWLKARFLSLSLVLGLGFLLTVSLVLSAALAAWGQWWAPWFTGLEMLLGVVNTVLGFGLTVLLFALIYRLMPSVKIAWNDVWIGAAMTAALFELGKAVIGFYIGTSGVASGFGAASSLIVVIVWVYYSAQLFLFGAEVTWVYANQWGSRAQLSKVT